MIDHYLVMRFTYDDILFGWDEALADIRALTKSRRHRVRTAANAAADVH